MKYETIKPYIEKKLISEQVHPENSDLRIFNYTQHCQFSGEWDEVTKQCRGLIMSVETGEILARPFAKFFNYGEHISKGWEIPKEDPMVFEKLDGSLGILYWIKGEPWIATRGSFMSDQAQWATKWFRENVEWKGLNQDWTLLFEIIYPENRIVVNYDYSGMVFISSRWTADGKETNNFSPPLLKTGKEMRRAERFPFASVENLIAVQRENFEGFVLYYPNSGVRLKIKLDEYVRLHKIVTGVSEIGIWEMLRDEKPLNELLDKVPDEFFNWVNSVASELIKKFNNIAGRARMDFREASDWADENGYLQNRKEIAQYFQTKQNPSILFAMLDDKPWAPIVWKMIRPRGQSTYKVDIDQ